MVVVIDLLGAVGVFLVVAIVAPDHGVTDTSLRQGFVLAVVFAAAPIVARARGTDSASIIGLGGGMMVAGVITTKDGNLLGSVVAFSGLLLLVVGASSQLTLTPGLIGRLLGCAIMLSAGMWLALDTTAMTGLAALLLAVFVATSTRRGSAYSAWDDR